MKLGVVILGAGASRRMGRSKLLLPWKGKTIIGHVLAQWARIGAFQVSVVLSEANVALTDELDRLVFPSANRIVNPEPELGMFSSIQRAACSDNWSHLLTHVVITLGDQPHIRTESLHGLVGFAQANESKICQPTLNGRPKHPVLLPAATFREICLSKNETLAQFLKEHEADRAYLEVADPGLALDVDTPSDYERLIKFAEE